MWSIEEYCASQTPWDTSNLSQNTLAFVQALNLPTLHPFCALHDDYYYKDIPRQGPLLSHYLETSWHDVLITLLAQVLPSLLAMAELWWRLLAFFVAPAGLVWMSTSRTYSAFVCLVTIAAAVIIMTDELYLLEFGPRYGVTIVWAAAILAWRTSVRISIIVVFLLCMTLYYGPSSPETAVVPEGLYYDTTQPHAVRIVQRWSNRTYAPATPWMPTGDARTGLPFLLNRAPTLTWHRLWLPLEDEEVVALDMVFPPHGHDTSKPVYLILHGLNGGSQEAYVREMAGRRLAENSTVVVLVARGLMDLPVRGWNVFHGARWTDVHEAAQVLRRALGPQQILAGVGYSMGGIILSNYVARTGTECALDAAVAISGGLDMRVEAQPNRAHRLWQPLVAVELRNTFVVGKWGERVRSRLSKDEMKALMRATNVAGIDKTAVVVYNGFRDLMVRVEQKCVYREKDEACVI